MLLQKDGSENGAINDNLTALWLRFWSHFCFTFA